MQLANEHEDHKQQIEALRREHELTTQQIHKEHMKATSLLKADFAAKLLHLQVSLAAA